jgi:hypothetical protein
MDNSLTDLEIPFYNYEDFFKSKMISFGMANSPISFKKDNTGKTIVEISYCGTMVERVRNFITFLDNETLKGNLSYILEKPNSTNYSGRRFSWYKFMIKLILP